MPLPRSFKTDESFLEKIAIGATGTRRTFDDLRDHGHAPLEVRPESPNWQNSRPKPRWKFGADGRFSGFSAGLLELERGSMSFKIWKAIKIKRVRVPDILCLKCSHRVESRAKTKMEISMSHSISQPERGWDSGLDDDDYIAFTLCQRTGSAPLDWAPSPLVQYVLVRALRQAWQAGQAIAQRPKGAQEGFEIRAVWPTALASACGVVEQVGTESIRYRKTQDNRAVTIQLNRPGRRLTPIVVEGDQVQPSQIIASIVPVITQWPCPGGADITTYADLSVSTSLSDRYTAAKALSRLSDVQATDFLLQRVRDTKEHIYIRLEAAAGLMRRQQPAGQEFIAAMLQDAYLQNRLEAVIILGEIASPEAARMLITTLQDPNQHPEIRAGAAWSLGEVGTREALPTLIKSFTTLDTIIMIEAARALAKLARKHVDDLLQAFPGSTPEERPGIAWALSKAGGLSIDQILPIMVDDDARQWVAYIIGTHDPEAMLPDIESLAAGDPQVYFAVTVLWKILSSWVYGLEEY